MAKRFLENVTYVPNWCSIAGALHGVARFYGIDYDDTDVMGLSGHAFALDVAPAPGQPFGAARAWVRGFPARYEPLGLEFEGVTSAETKTLHKAARKAIDHGSPAVANGLFLPEFGLIAGYDDGAKQFAVSTQLDEQGRRQLGYDRWPDGPPRQVLWVKRSRPIARKQALETGLRQAAALAQAATAAYERWAQAMESHEPVAAANHAHLIQVVHTSRFRAANFAGRAADELGQDLAGAQDAYRAAGLELSRLGTLFPYPNGGEIDDEFLRTQAARVLRRVAELEARAAQALAR